MWWVSRIGRSVVVGRRVCVVMSWQTRVTVVSNRAMTGENRGERERDVRFMCGKDGRNGLGAGIFMGVWVC